MSGNRVGVHALVWVGGFGSSFSIQNTLQRAAPLILTGLAATVAFRAKLWNIGAEGQLYAGALAAVAVGVGMNLSRDIMSTGIQTFTHQ